MATGDRLAEVFVAQLTAHWIPNPHGPISGRVHRSRIFLAAIRESRQLEGRRADGKYEEAGHGGGPAEQLVIATGWLPRADAGGRLNSGG